MKILDIINEEWSQKYKNSINCSHPKGFGQKAHCAGKKKHTESMMTMEAVCPDCGMCQTHGNLNEIKKGQKDSNGFTRCWPGKHAVGTKKGKNGGQVRNCKPNESQGVAEGQENYNGIDISMEIQKDDEYVDDEDYDNQVLYVTASSKGKELGHVLFAFDGEYLMPQDLEVEERYRGQGIAQTMYDYVKSKGYKIRRSGQQTDAGAGFWDKHKPGKNVWEQGVAEDIDLEERFNIIESMIEYWAEHHGVDSDVIWEDLEEVDDEDLLSEAEAWQTSRGKNKNGGLNKKGVSSYRSSHPGSHLQTAVTTKPSKLKPGSKAAKRRKSFCARMKGMKKHRTGSKTARDPNSRINKSLRKWNCH